MIPVYIGYDHDETVAWHVLCHSILARSSQPVSFIPLALDHLSEIYTRPRDALQSTDFSFTRFLVPHLSGYTGWSIYLDCDIIMQADIAELWALRDEQYSVMCVKHQHIPSETTKFLGATQTVYPKKNWSSVLLYNNAKCATLTPEYVNSATGLDLHQFRWLDHEHEIGALPRTWNHLVGYDVPDDHAKNIHFTTGGPYFQEYSYCEHSGTWFRELDKVVSRKEKS